MIILHKNMHNFSKKYKDVGRLFFRTSISSEKSHPEYIQFTEYLLKKGNYFE